MLRLVTIDLIDADLKLFDAYEAKVLALLPKHGGKLEFRLRALDAGSETHLLFFPSDEAFEAYRTDSARTATQDDWERCGARSSLTLVERLGSWPPSPGTEEPGRGP